MMVTSMIMMIMIIMIMIIAKDAYYRDNSNYVDVLNL